jgi:hypothetical protein
MQLFTQRIRNKQESPEIGQQKNRKTNDDGVVVSCEVFRGAHKNRERIAGDDADGLGCC